jgi:hypothetical protein
MRDILLGRGRAYIAKKDYIAANNDLSRLMELFHLHK